MTITAKLTKDSLERVRTIMADPNRVVLNAEHLYEDHEGHPISRSRGEDMTDIRGCLIAWVSGSDRVFSSSIDALAVAANELDIPIGLSGNLLTEAVREGRHLEVLDRAISKFNS